MVILFGFIAVILFGLCMYYYEQYGIWKDWAEYYRKDAREQFDRYLEMCDKCNELEKELHPEHESIFDDKEKEPEDYTENHDYGDEDEHLKDLMKARGFS